MMGDNRDNSNDSRTTSVGTVPSENLIGKAQFLFFSHRQRTLVAGLEMALRYSIRPYRGWHCDGVGLEDDVFATLEAEIGHVFTDRRSLKP